MANAANTIESLKAKGRYFHAGALAASVGLDSMYGCHYGFVSDRMKAVAEFKAGHQEVTNCFSLPSSFEDHSPTQSQYDEA